MALIAELQRRKVFKVGAAYLVVGWLLIQVAATVGPQLSLPEWAPRLITFLILLGFPIALVMAWVFDVTSEGVRLDAGVSGSKRVIAAAVVMAALAVGWYLHGRTVLRPTSPVAVATQSTGTSGKAVSIAVLPFLDMSQTHDQEYFSDGLSEELLNLLAQLPQMRVIARTSSFSFKGKEVDVATIARTLGVANVLEGSVRKSGNTLRITAQLIRASDSSHLWSQTYDRELTDVFKVQDEIAAAVVDALKVQLLPRQALTNAHRSTNPEAYNQYLLGVEFSRRLSPDNWRRAIDAERRAIALDPNYAPAYATLAYSEGWLADSLGDSAMATQALAHVDKAIELAPDIVDGYVVRGVSRLSARGDWQGAKADYEKAFAINPNDSQVQNGYSRVLTAVGKLPEAIAAGRRAVALDPVSGDAWTLLGRLLNATGDTAGARKALQRAVELAPDSAYAQFHLGETDLLDGKPKDALPHFALAASYGFGGRAMAEHSLGHAAASQQALDQQIAKYSQASAYQIAEVYAWRGEKDKAFEWLDRAVAQHDGGLSFFKSDPLIASLRGDPRYAAMLRTLKLPR